MRGDPRVTALLDTLSSLEREREGFDASGSADPAFVAITTRVNEIGRELQGLAAQRRAAARTTLAALTVQRVVVQQPVDDTTPHLVAAADARGRIAAAEAALVRARENNVLVVKRLAEAQ